MWGKRGHITEIPKRRFHWFLFAGLCVALFGCSGNNNGGTEAKAPFINLTESVLIFTATEGNANPAAQVFDVLNTGGKTLDWTITTDVSWLTVSPTGNTTTETDTVAVSVDIAGLTVNKTYRGKVTISDQAADNDPQVVEIFLIVESSSPMTDFPFTNRPFKTGIGPIPRNFPDGFDTSDFLDMYGKVATLAELMAVQGDWQDDQGDPDAAPSGQIPNGLKPFLLYKDTYNYEPVPAISFFQGEAVAILNTQGNSTNDWTNADAQAKYEQVALDIIQTYDVNYLGLGIEVNTYWQYELVDFDRFVAAYKQMYANIKAVHPNVKLFVSFQLEKMKGIGIFSGPSFGPHWSLIDQFGDTLDVVAFTTYPGIEYTTVADIPEDYYLEIRKYTNKPILFTEIGWSSAMNDVQDQKDFILKFFRLSEGLNKEFVTWAFMHDLNTPPTGSPLDYIGLRDSDGIAKLSWSSWQMLKAMSYTGP